MKMIMALLAAALLLLGFCACGETAGGSGGSEGAGDASSITKEAVSRRTVVGEVDSIVGNEATLLIAEIKGGGMAVPGGVPAGEDVSGDATEQSGQPDAGEEASAPEINGETPAGGAWQGTAPSGDFTGERPTGGFREGGMPSGDFTGGNLPTGGQGDGSVEIEYTGETEVYDLPAGMAIGGGDFTDVTEGMVLRLTFSTYEDGTEAISSVEILSR